jgi:MFS family permease
MAVSYQQQRAADVRVHRSSTHAFSGCRSGVIFLQRGGLSLGQIGGLEFGAMVLMAVAEVPTGTVADTWGRKTSLVIGAFLHGIATLGVLAEVLSPVFLLAYACWGASLTFLSGASEALLYDSLKAEGDAASYTHAASRMMTSGLVAWGPPAWWADSSRRSTSASALSDQRRLLSRDGGGADPARATGA